MTLEVFFGLFHNFETEADRNEYQSYFDSYNLDIFGFSNDQSYQFGYATEAAQSIQIGNGMGINPQTGRYEGTSLQGHPGSHLVGGGLHSHSHSGGNGHLLMDPSGVVGLDGHHVSGQNGFMMHPHHAPHHNQHPHVNSHHSSHHHG